MNLVDSFIMMSAISYFAAVVLPFQFEKKMPMPVQKIVFFILFIVLFFVPLSPNFNTNIVLLLVIGFLYSFMAAYCFGGGQDWGSTEHNLLMTVWDLALATCFLSKIII